MISLIIFSTILTFNTALILIFKKKNQLFSFPFWVLILSFCVVLVGITFVVWQEIEIKNELLKRNWTAIGGEIIESEIVGERALRAEIKYKYKVMDVVYYGNSDYNIPGFGGKNYRRKNARIVKNENPTGSKITVYFNPQNPEISILRYGPYWSNYMIIGFGSFLLFIGMFIIEWQLFTKIKTKEK